MSTAFTVEYVNADGSISETTIRAEDEDEALDIFEARRPDVTATVAYAKDES